MKRLLLITLLLPLSAFAAGLLLVFLLLPLDAHADEAEHKPAEYKLVINEHLFRPAELKIPPAQRSSFLSKIMMSRRKNSTAMR